MALLGILIATGACLFGAALSLRCLGRGVCIMRAGALADEAIDRIAERIVAGDVVHLPRQLRKTSSHSTPIAHQGE
jgi:hypothetical protein